MVRPFCVVMCMVGLLQGQDPAVLGTCLSPGGRPVAEAEVLLLGDPEPPVALLAGWAASFQPPPCRTAVNGDFCCPIAASAATVLVRHKLGLGGLMARAVPRAPFRLELQPMAELRIEGSDVEVHAVVDDPIFGRRHLPVLHGVPVSGTGQDAVRLPGGVYELWVLANGRWSWLTKDLGPCAASGDPLPLALPKGPVRTLELPSETGHRITPRGWPDTVLLDAARPRAELAIAGPIPLVVEDRTGQLLEMSVPEGVDHWQPRLPAGPTTAGDVTVHTGGGGKADKADVWVLRWSGDEWHPAAHARTGADGKARLPLGDPMHCLVLALRSGSAPAALSGERVAKGTPLVLDDGRKLKVTCLDPDGGEAPGTALALAPSDMPEAAIAFSADSRGLATIVHAPTGGCVLRAVDPRFLNQTIEVGPGDALVRVQLAAGARISGRIRTADGAPAGGVAVTLRDPSGRLQPPVRTIVADSTGSFTFRGLPEQGAFILFAQQLRGASKWSAHLQQVTPNHEWNLELRSEDPPLPGGEHR
jgi:hypothetical protein